MALSKKRKSSELWQFFQEFDENFAVCNMCKAKLSYKTSTSNLKKHLKSKHPTIVLPANRSHLQVIGHAVLEEIEDDLFDPSVQASTSCQQPPAVTQHSSTQIKQPSLLLQNISSSSPQPSGSKQNSSKVLQQSNLGSFPGFRNMSSKSKSSIDKTLLLLIVKDFQPISIVEDKGFRDFVAALNPTYELPNRHSISKTLLPALYEECLHDTRNNITNGKSFCVTTDYWTSNKTENYIGVTAHYLDENFKLNSILLECSKTDASHKAEDIAEALRRIAQSWGIDDKITIAVSDNAMNMVKAIQRVLGWNHFGCLAHTLNLIVKDALKCQDIERIIDKVKKIVEHFKRSCIASEKLSRYQSTSGTTPLKLIQEVPTRWNSLFYMVERFVSLEEALKSTMAIIEKDLPKLYPEEWNILKELCNILKPFEDATKAISGESYCTASLAIPLSNGLRNVQKRLSRNQYSIPIMNVLKKLEEGIDTRLGTLQHNNTLALATFLDPRFKEIAFDFDSSASGNVKDLVTDLVAQKIAEESNVSETLEMEIGDELSIWLDFDKTVATVQPEGTVTSKSIIEVQRYLEDGILPRNKDPLKWWNEHKLIYPHLAKLAQETLCALASSVPCERLFSKAGQVLTDRRNRLGDSKVNMILFLNANYHP